MGEYEVSDLAFTFDDYDYTKNYIDTNELDKNKIPKEKYFLNEKDFYKLMNSRQMPPYHFAPYSFERFLYLDDIMVTITDVKDITKEEISKDRFLSDYNKNYDLSKVKVGYILKIIDNSDEKYNQYFYLFDNEYYTYDELYAYKIVKY